MTFHPDIVDVLGNLIAADREAAAQHERYAQKARREADAHDAAADRFNSRVEGLAQILDAVQRFIADESAGETAVTELPIRTVPR